MEKRFCVYMLSNKWHGTIYTGMSGDLPLRTYNHKTRAAEGFTKKYFIDKLIWYEMHATAADAALREKRIKEWKRDWKIRLIEANNPEWRDLYDEICL